MSIFTGSGTAIVTPFNNDGTINFSALENIINFQIENNTDAIIICGTTGEASTLTDEEQIDAIKFTVDVVKKRVPVIAGAGSNHTESGVNLCEKSEEVGADGLLIVTPYYNKTTQKGLIKYYETIASSVSLPIIMYNVPSRTGLNIEPSTVLHLSKISNIVGIKEASGNISQIAKICTYANDEFYVYSGNDDHILPVLSLGGKGVISVLSNIIPKDVHNMVKLFLDGNITDSLNIQLNAMELINSLFSEVNPIPIKTALNLMGFNAGKLREPLVEMEEQNLQRLKTSMKNYGLKLID